MITLSSVAYDDSISNWKMNPSSTLNHIIIFVSGGRLTYTIDGDDINLGEGDLLYIPENTFRSGANFTNQLHQKYSAHFKLMGHEQSSLLTNIVYKKANTNNFNYIK